MKAKGCEFKLDDNDPGFTLPSNISELGDGITKLDLSWCSLRGAFVVRGMTRHTAHGSELKSESHMQGRCR